MLPALTRLDRPAFIVGCGRSGTTAMGSMLARHPAVLYLNERRDLWSRVTPAADIWSPEAEARNGSLELTAAAGSWRARRRLRKLLARELARAGKPRLVEKLPINSFRLPFIEAALPEARYVHIVRDGVEVAASIARFCETERWFGAGDYKWRLLVARAARDAQTRDLPALCGDDFERGLLEWRLSVEAALGFLERLPARRVLTVRYEEFVDAPVRVLADLERFLELTPSEDTRRFAASSVARRSDSASVTHASVDMIAGELRRRLGYGLEPRCAAR